MTLLSTTEFPCLARVRLAGLVCCRSVKYLGALLGSETEEDARERWWTELREEVGQHARALRCQQVLGYRETYTVRGDAIILSAEGTACRIRDVIQRKSASPMPEEWENIFVDPRLAVEALAVRMRAEPRLAAPPHVTPISSPVLRPSAPMDPLPETASLIGSTV